MEHFTATGHPDNNAAEATGNLVTCKRCGDDKLAWKKSAKTGRWYLCDVLSCGRWATRQDPTYRRYFVMARTPHKCPQRTA